MDNQNPKTIRDNPTINDGFLNDYLAYLMARSSFLVSEHFHRQLEKSGMSVPFWRVLAALETYKRLSVGKLARIVLYKQPTLTKILDRMIDLDLVRRVSSEDDRRRVEVTIAPAGHKLVSRLIVEAKAHEAQILMSYSPAEVATLKHVLSTLIDRLDPS